MWWRRLWPQRQPGKLSDKARSTLESQYAFDSKSTEGLLCLEKPGKFSGRRVRNIRIFDPTLVRNGGKSVRTYDDLLVHRRALLFEGHIEKDGSVRLSDRRVPKSTKPVQSKPSSG